MSDKGSLQATLDGDLLHPVTVIGMPVGPVRTAYMKTSPGDRDVFATDGGSDDR